MTTKDYIEEIALLPSPVKIGAGIIAAVFLMVILLVGLNNYNLSKKAENLEKANAELQTQVEAAEKKVIAAETLAENERLKAENLESQIQPLNEKGQNEDKKIVTQKSNTETLRRRLDSIRRGKLPESTNINANARTDSEEVDELKRQLANRYESGKDND